MAENDTSGEWTASDSQPEFDPWESSRQSASAQTDSGSQPKQSAPAQSDPWAQPKQSAPAQSDPWAQPKQSAPAQSDPWAQPRQSAPAQPDPWAQSRQPTPAQPDPWAQPRQPAPGAQQAWNQQAWQQPNQQAWQPQPAAWQPPVPPRPVDNRTFDERNSRALCILAYLGPLFFLMVLLIGDLRKDDLLRFHVNQALAFMIVEVILACIPILGWLAEIVLFVFWIIAFVGACQGKATSAPAVGAIHIIR